MSYLKKVSILKVILVLAALMMFHIDSFSVWVSNGSGGAYDGDGNGSGSGSSGGDTISCNDNANAIDTYIALGGGYFLKSYSKTLSFMNKTELASLYGMDYNDLQVHLSDALWYMEMANYTYGYLHQIAINTPYNPVVIQSLKEFDYQGFCSENHCNREIFNQVQSYLSNGKVTEMYGKIIAYTQKIIDLLKLVKGDIDQKAFPSTKNVRRLNQAYSTTLLFGQYVADVFESI